VQKFWRLGVAIGVQHMVLEDEAQFGMPFFGLCVGKEPLDGRRPPRGVDRG
jgi:hypothetical protein